MFIVLSNYSISFSILYQENSISLVHETYSEVSLLYEYFPPCGYKCPVHVHSFKFFPVDLQAAKCSTLNCSFDCKLTPDGATCYCPPGQVTVNATQCTDYDECALDEHTCDQMCHNTFGSFECSCVPGYTRNNTHCYAVNGNYTSVE